MKMEDWILLVRRWSGDQTAAEEIRCWSKDQTAAEKDNDQFQKDWRYYTSLLLSATATASPNEWTCNFW